MLKIASYSLQGQIVRVKLKCTCGASKVLEVQEEDQTIYFCGKCRARKTLAQLKKEASSYWRLRNWIVACESDQRVNPRVHADFPVELTVKTSAFSPPYCTLHGRVVVLSSTGLLAVVEDFSESYFHDITSACRHVEINVAKPLEGFPHALTGRIVAVRYRPDTLPQGSVAIGFEGLTGEVGEMVRRYVQEHHPPTTHDLGETGRMNPP